MKQGSIDALKALLGEIAACDHVVFTAECQHCSKSFDEECGKCCKVFYTFEAMALTVDAIEDVLEAVQHA